MYGPTVAVATRSSLCDSAHPRSLASSTAKDCRSTIIHASDHRNLAFAAQGLSFRQIGLSVGISASTVQGYVERARAGGPQLSVAGRRGRGRARPASDK